MMHSITAYSLLGGFILVLCILALLSALKKPVYRRKGQLLLLNEQRFLAALLQALPADTYLTFKVRLLDIVSVTHARTGRSMDRDLADYCVDFVLVDRNTTDVRLCIEMDMESVTATERLARNTFISRALRRAGIPHLRLPLLRYYDPVRLREVLHEALNTPLPATSQEKPRNSARTGVPAAALS